MKFFDLALIILPLLAIIAIYWMGQLTPLSLILLIGMVLAAVIGWLFVPTRRNDPKIRE